MKSTDMSAAFAATDDEVTLRRGIKYAARKQRCSRVRFIAAFTHRRNHRRGQKKCPVIAGGRLAPAGDQRRDTRQHAVCHRR